MLIDEICAELGVRSERVAHLALTASNRYFVFPISKRDGSQRWIAHPSRPLKLLQRWINFRVFRHLPVHDAAMAYRKGRNIRENAVRHKDSRYTVRIDFKDFFPSFHAKGVRKFLHDMNGLYVDLDVVDIDFVVRVVSRNDALTIGAPSSPVITNAMMYLFDSALASACADRDLIYTRYADDLFISSTEPGRLSDIPALVQELAAIFPYSSLNINPTKTAFLSRKYHREITGLVITPEGRLSIGRDRKREIKSLVHRYSAGAISSEKLAYLRGLLAFAEDVEPKFIFALNQKYGPQLVSSIYRKQVDAGL